MSQQNKNLIVFLDSISRTIIGNKVSETEDSVTVENPALVHVIPNQTQNNLQLQILPVFFREFLADRNESTRWVFKKSNITLSEDMVFAAQFAAQYEQIFNGNAGAPPEPNKSADVVKLFDDE